MTITVRRALESDVRAVYELSNQQSIREKSFRPASIGWPEHVAWFNEAIKNPDYGFYIAEHNGQIAGQIRFSVDASTAIISISVSESFRRKGIGRKMFQLALGDFQQGRRALQIVAKIKPDNQESISFFQSLGFTLASSGNSEQTVMSYSRLEESNK